MCVLLRIDAVVLFKGTEDNLPTAKWERNPEISHMYLRLRYRRIKIVALS